MTTTLPEPQFIERDPAVIEQQVFSDWEAQTGVALTPNQPEWMMLKVIAYRESLVRMAIQEACKQNLLAYARFPMIDYLGQLLGAPRLGPEFARTTIRFALETPAVSPIAIPAETRVRTQNGLAVFRVLEDAELPAGELHVDVLIEAIVAGTQANGYLPGQVSELVDATPGIDSVENITLTAGGAGTESDERYQERLLRAPDRQSTAGATATYVYHALSASGAIEDVYVFSPEPLVVHVVLLDDGGSITPEIIALVAAALNPETVRPQTETVVVLASDSDDWTLDVSLTLYADADPSTTLLAAQKAAAALIASRRKLGRSARVEQIKAKLAVPGVYSVTLNSPTTDVDVTPTSWARCVGNTVIVGGFSPEPMP